MFFWWLLFYTTILGDFFSFQNEAHIAQPKNGCLYKMLSIFFTFFLLFHNCERVSVSGCVFFLVYLSNNCYKYLCKYRPIPKTDRTGKTWVSKMSRFVQVCLCVCVIRKIYFLTNTCNTNMLRQSFVV